MAEIYLAGGCFWGVEQYLKSIRGVLITEVGYANGHFENPTYEQVCHQGSGHAEAVKVIYDEKILPLSFLLSLFFEVIDPTSVNKQGNDSGVQYRSGIYYTNEKDLPVIQDSINKLQVNYKKPIVIEVMPLKQFSLAEEYHQNYLDKNPFGYCHIGKEQFQKASQAMVPKEKYIAKDQEQLKENLTQIQYDVTQLNGTEPPFKNEYWNFYQQGIYVDITSGEPLFSSTDKFESGCGWPSFSKPIDPNVINEKRDLSHGMNRTEVRSRIADAHLGHVFEDGPKELGEVRYCINSAALRFIPKEKMEEEGYGYLLNMVK